mgnify:CR=1 FL=1
MKQVRERRQRGARVSANFLRIKMFAAVALHYPHNNFTASRSWQLRFRKRFNLRPRRAQKTKKKSAGQRAPKIKYWHHCFHRMLSSPRAGDGYWNDKWGRFPPSYRFNVDQVPLPFIVSQDSTMHEHQEDPTERWIDIIQQIYNVAVQQDAEAAANTSP